MSSSLFTGGGPPEPILVMRSTSIANEGDEATSLENGHRESNTTGGDDGLPSSSSSSSVVADAASLSSSRLRRPRKQPRPRQRQEPPCRDPPAAGEAWPRRDCLSFTRSLVFYGYGSITDEREEACRSIEEVRALRRKYFGILGDADDAAVDERLATTTTTTTGGLNFRFGPNGVAEIYREADEAKENLVPLPTVNDFVEDYNRLVTVSSSGSVRSFSFQRLQMLRQAFKMHVTANSGVENQAQSSLLGTDFYRTMKVDNHVHLAAAFSAKMFVEFVRNKLTNEGDTVVNEQGRTLRQVFDDAGLDLDHLTIDAFHVMADYSVYQRFDNFNSKYSPFRMAQMRRIFLKTDNHMGGRYFAELTKQVFTRYELDKGHVAATELRVSIYGMEYDEWERLAKWVLKDDGDRRTTGKMLSTHNRWLVQIPRLWRIYSSKTDPATGRPRDRDFSQMLRNIFAPVFEATLFPEKHPLVAELLTHVVGIDSVDDEGHREEACDARRPDRWTDRTRSPAYAWQLYHLWANLAALNRLRRARGLNTLAFRPHAGETGDVMHLAATYLLCTSINHGINLDNQVSLQYLYYLDQIGLSVSPLSNNFLFRKISDSPFKKLFERGLNVTLSTDDPLLFHMSDDALLEEYSVARASFDLSMTDMSEIARNSVLQSGFEHEWKQTWLGEHYRRGVNHCDENRTHVPLIRAKFRSEHLALEHMFVALVGAGKGQSALEEMMVQFGTARDAHRKVLNDNALEVPRSL